MPSSKRSGRLGCASPVVLSEAEFKNKDYLFKLRQEELEAAENNLQLVRVGASKRSGKVSNLVRATVDGMVIEVPVKEGGSVIEANTFNEGTTIAAIADMSDIIFDGRVDESDVSGLREGMPVSITVGALNERRFAGKLTYISPKGVEKDGTIEFEIKATVEIPPGTFVRANYSANADIVLDRRNKVLALNESWVKYEGDKTFVEVETAPHHFKRRPVDLGLSDGIWVEVKSGLTKTTRVKKQETYTAPKPASGG
jgi:HlyD family secretion protein